MAQDLMTSSDQITSVLGKTDFKRKETPTASVTSITPPVLDDDGVEVKAGAVSFTNDVGSNCVMTISQFQAMYE